MSTRRTTILLTAVLMLFGGEVQAAVEPGEPGGNYVHLILFPSDFEGGDLCGVEFPAASAGTLMLNTDGATINGYVIRSGIGMFTRQLQKLHEVVLTKGGETRCFLV